MCMDIVVVASVGVSLLILSTTLVRVISPKSSNLLSVITTLFGAVSQGWYDSNLSLRSCCTVANRR